MPSLRQEAAAFSPLDSISVATCSAFSNAACRLSLANTAFQGGRGPCRVLVADPGQDVAHEVDHAPLVSRVFLVKLVFRFGGGDVLLDSGVLVL